MPKNLRACVNCGAPIISGKCEYCGTVYEQDDISAQKARLMEEIQRTVLEIHISKQLEEMNVSLEQQKKQQNKSLIDRLFGR